MICSLSRLVLLSPGGFRQRDGGDKKIRRLAVGIVFRRAGIGDFMLGIVTHEKGSIRAGSRSHIGGVPATGKLQNLDC